MLRGIIGMGHDHIQGGEIIAAGIQPRCTEQGLKRAPADANVETIDTRAIQIGNAVVFSVRGDEGGEGQDAVGLVKKQGVTEGGGGFDFRKRAGDVFCY